MKNILIIGKADPCFSIVRSLSNTKLPLNHSDEIAYYLKYNDGKWSEGLIPFSIDQYEKMKRDLIVFDFVYIFPDKLSEGLEKVNFFHELGTCKVFVISHTVRYSRISRQLADYVITSLSEKSQYHWLINKEALNS